MYKVNESSSRKFKEYVLEDLNAGTRAVIVPERGGILSSFSLNSKEFIYFDEENFYGDDRPRCGMPILFPCCGRTNEEKYTVSGKEYPMPIHGIAHTSAWSVKEFKDEEKASVTIELASNEESKKYYPFDFKVTYTYELQGSKLTLNQIYKNEGQVPMAFGFGFHPYFNISGLENVELEVNAKGALNFITGALEPFENPVKMPIMPESHGLFMGAEKKIISRDKVLGNQIQVEFDNHYGIMMLWSLREKNFLCIEPWNDMPNALNTGAKNLLNPGEELRSTMSITIGMGELI